MPLDTFVAQIAYRARLLERALHDAGPWTIRCETGLDILEMPAQRYPLSDGVGFRAEFPALIEMDGTFHLCWKGEPCSTKAMKIRETPFAIEWAIRGFVNDYQPSG